MEGNQMLLELPWSHTPTDSWCVNTFEENSLSCKELFWELFVTPWVVFQCVCLLWEATTPYCRRKGFHLQKSWRMFTSIISTTSGSLVWISDRRIPPPVHLLPKTHINKDQIHFSEYQIYPQGLHIINVITQLVRGLHDCQLYSERLISPMSNDRGEEGRGSQWMW